MERVRHQYAEAVEAEMQRRQDAEELSRTIELKFKQARVAAKRSMIAKAVAESRAQKQAEIQGYIGDMRSRERLLEPAIRQLDEIGITSRLEEINQDIWSNRGTVFEQMVVDDKYKKYIIGKKYILLARVPTISNTITEIIKNGSQYTSGKVYQGEKPNHWSIVDDVVGFRTRYESDEDIHSLTVSFTSETNKNFGMLQVNDESTKRPQDNSKNHIGTSLRLSPFNLEQADELIHNALIQSSVHRTDHPIDTLYQQGLKDREWLRKKGGSGYTEEDYADSRQAPLSWRIKSQGQRLIDGIKSI